MHAVPVGHFLESLSGRGLLVPSYSAAVSQGVDCLQREGQHSHSLP